MVKTTAKTEDHNFKLNSIIELSNELNERLNLAKKRQLQVVRKMVNFNVITEEEAKKILESGEEES